ncbi:hypothetical protein BDV10DRAFT_4332 [Aspergillus recurvatus]
MRLRKGKKKSRGIESPSRAPRIHCQSAAELTMQSCCGPQLQLSRLAFRFSCFLAAASVG